MRYTVFAKVFALLLAACMLAGCGRAAEETASTVPVITEPVPTQPAQSEMPQQALEMALLELEYSLLAAALEAESRVSSFRRWQTANPVYVGDIDGDGLPELAHSVNTLFFDIDQNRNLEWLFTQGGTYFHTDNAGVFYYSTVMGGGYEEETDGQILVYDSWYESYRKRSGDTWESAFSCSSDTVQAASWSEDAGYTMGEFLQNEERYTLENADITREEYEAHVEQIGLTAVTTTPQDYTVHTYQATYAESLTQALVERLSQAYGTSAVRKDIDADGQEETVIAAAGLLDPWLESLDRNLAGTEWIAQGAVVGTLSTDHGYTGLLVLDRKGEDLVVTASCARTELNLYEGMELSYSGQCLWLDSMAVYAPGQFASLDDLDDQSLSQVWQGFVQFMTECGYSQISIKTADISDAPGPEVLCLCQKDGQWYVLVFLFRNGSPAMVRSVSLSDSAVYLTESAGRPALLIYTQAIYSGGYTHYYYSLGRLDSTGLWQGMDDQSVGYYSDQTDATQVAAFFDLLNTYLMKIFVVADPYRLSGSQWMPQDQTDFGTVPPEPEPEQVKEYAMGFVQINNPSSWLNLREGPGTEYPCVYLDPGDPNSMVRQALGAPVTVLETVETGDPENPVWVKVRIQYAEQTIEGYSSKTYIRLAEEE